jgi:hypothetical protein
LYPEISINFIDFFVIFGIFFQIFLEFFETPEASVEQLVVHQSVKLEVAGSSPAGGVFTIKVIVFF